MSWWYALVACVGGMHWLHAVSGMRRWHAVVCHALVACVGGMRWWHALVTCVGDMRWLHALVVCMR